VIRKSFIFLPGISYNLEKSLWNQGILNWNDFLKSKKIKGISTKRKNIYNLILNKVKSELFSLNSDYFIDKLPSSENWRLYKFFENEVVFLDIEVEHVTKDVTVIGLFDGIDTKIMIRGYNLDMKVLKQELLKYKLIVTYNGSTFDIPFLNKRYPGLIPKIPCFDLKVGCRRLGLIGGLKEVEKKLNIKRSQIIKKLTNGDPYLLYRMWKGSGDNYYLKLLVEYNEEDVINLKKIANYVSKNLS